MHQRFRITGTITPLTYGAMHKAVGSSVHVPTRPMGGWLMTYGQIGPAGGIIPTTDREGHIVEAARELGHIDWTEYLEKGLWNDTHLLDKATDCKIIVGVPTLLEFHDGTTELAKAHRKVGFFTAGHLFDRNDPASWSAYSDYVPNPSELDRSDYFWGLAQMLKGLPRQLGLSADGLMALDPETKTRIIYAVVKQAAVCEIPQSPDATLEPLMLAAQRGFDTPLEIMAKAIAQAQGAPHAETSSMPADSPIVPEDLEGDDEDRSVARLVKLIASRFMVSEAKAKAWVRNYISRRKAHV